ncbi:MAG: S8 family serine peptidase [Ruminococcus flavefaciens]|nr:S8 family serine peptidase [Ruminococcus flavefaciens]
MKIAIIDDGVNKEIVEYDMGINCHYHYINHISKQDIRHGTKVIETVEKYSCITKEYEIYDVMNTKKSSSSMAVIAALENLLHHKADIILMCLVIQNDETFERIGKLCHELRERGSILIASASNSDDYSFPAVLEDVIGVGRMADCRSAQTVDKVALEC